MVKEASDKVQVMGGTAQDGAGGTKSVGAIDGVKQTVTDVVAQTVTDVVTQTATNVVAEYVKMTGAGRARLVPVSYVDELLATLVSGGVTVVEPLAGVPVEVCDIKGRAAAGELLVADVRTIGAEFSPACRLGAEIAVAEDARVPGYVVVCMRKCCIPWVAEAVEAKACSTDDVTVSATGAEEQASARVSRHAASDAAQVVAAYLACHPRVEVVRYPGLKTDPNFARATSQLVGGFGPYVDYMWKESPGEWHRFTATDEDARTQIINFER
ncbi:MAG: PLP-dependent transferase, partial [Atopobium sp.]|nr:PLP-dependent transferase [Atopobium sp.]